MPKIERKVEYFPIMGGEIKATNDAKGIIEGYLNYIGNIDFGDDRTMPGAFKRTISEAYARKSQQHLDFLYPYLWNHNYSIPPAGGIFEANEDRRGLYVKAQMNMDTEMGRDLYSSFKSGFLKKQSMGYIAQSVDWVKEDGKSIRNLLEVEVKEGSAVVFPMNDLAQVDTVKNGRRSFYMPNKLPTKQEMPAITKDYAASYAETMQQDWVSDLWNLWYPLRNEIIVAFQTGDTPVDDVKTAAGQFVAALVAYVQRGVELGMTEYLQPADDSGDMPMYMSAQDNPDKETKKLSAASHAKLTKALSGMEGHIKEMKSELSRQRANALQGYQVYSNDDPVPEQKQDDESTTEQEQEDEDEARRLNKQRLAVYNLASMLQYQNADKGI